MNYLIENSDLVRVIAIVVFSAYNIMVTQRYGVLNSISQSDYFLKRGKWMFEAVMVICGLSIIVTGIQFTNILLIVGGGFICLVAVFARYNKNKFYKSAHLTSAYLGFLLCVISFTFDGKELLSTWWISLFILIPAGMTYLNSKRYEVKEVDLNVELVLSYLLFIGLKLAF